MNHRDQEYVENRLMDTSRFVEAAGRMKQAGYGELANDVILATADFNDKLREIRRQLNREIVRRR